VQSQNIVQSKIYIASSIYTNKILLFVDGPQKFFQNHQRQGGVFEQIRAKIPKPYHLE
jgi:hypothetical protein